MKTKVFLGACLASLVFSSRAVAAPLGEVELSPVDSTADEERQPFVEGYPIPPGYPGRPTSTDPYDRGVQLEYFCVFLSVKIDDGSLKSLGISRERWCELCVQDSCKEFFKDKASQDACIAVGNATCDQFAAPAK